MVALDKRLLVIAPRLDWHAAANDRRNVTQRLPKHGEPKVDKSAAALVVLAKEDVLEVCVAVDEGERPVEQFSHDGEAAVCR